MRIRMEFKAADCWIGLFWRDERISVPCDDPQCGDSTWDHDCNLGYRHERHLWITMVPMFPIHISWRLGS